MLKTNLHSSCWKRKNFIVKKTLQISQPLPKNCELPSSFHNRILYNFFTKTSPNVIFLSPKFSLISFSTYLFFHWKLRTSFLTVVNSLSKRHFLITWILSGINHLPISHLIKHLLLFHTFISNIQILTWRLILPLDEDHKNETLRFNL